MSIIYLVLYVLLFSYIISALSGLLMFIRDIIKHGRPHSKFEVISSIEAYNEKLNEESENSLSASSESSESVEIEL